MSVIKDLLRLCEEQRGKDNKAVVASNIMYIVGKCIFEMLSRVLELCDVFVGRGSGLCQFIVIPTHNLLYIETIVREHLSLPFILAFPALLSSPTHRSISPLFARTLEVFEDCGEQIVRVYARAPPGGAGHGV